MATGTLTGQTIANTYKSLLKITGTTAGGETLHATTQKVIEDGDGNPFPLSAAADALMITSTNRLEFGDDASYIHQSADGVLDLVSDTEIELNATTIDINGAVDMSSTLTVADDVNFDSNTLFVDASESKVGIGAVPASGTADFLQITTPASGGGHGISFNRNDNNPSQLIGRLIAGNSVDAELASITFNSDGANDSGNIIFNTEATGGSLAEAMRIDSSGKVGVGVSPAKVFHVEKSVAGDFISRIKNTDGTNGEGLQIHADNTSSSHRALDVRNSNGQIFQIYNDGNIVIKGDGSDQTTKWHTGSAYVNAKLDVRQLAIAFSGVDKVTSDTSGNFTFASTIFAQGGGSSSNRLEFIADTITSIGSNLSFVTDGGTSLTLTRNDNNATFGGNIIIDGSSSRSIEFYDGSEREGAIVFDEATDGFIFKVGGTGGALSDAVKILNTGQTTFKCGTDYDQIRLVDTNSDQTTQRTSVNSQHYLSAEEDVRLIGLFSNGSGASATDNIVGIGGGSGSHNSATSIQFYTAANATTVAGNTRMVIDSSGNVTVGGSATAQNTLHVQGTGITISEGDRDRCSIHSTFSGTTDGAMIFKIRESSSPVEKMRIHTNGNVGIGETNPSTKLHVKNDAQEYTALLQNANGDGTILDLFASASDDHTADALFRCRTDARTLFQIGNSGKMQHDGDCASDFVMQVRNNGNNDNRLGIKVIAGADNASNAGSTTYFEARTGNDNSTGNLVTSSGTFQLVDVSDKRVKTNIVDTEIKGLESVNNMKIRDFNWLDDNDEAGAKVIGGFIAQELKEVFEPAVTGDENSTDENGKMKPMGVSRDRLVPVLVKAIQELSAKVTELENKLGE